MMKIIEKTTVNPNYDIVVGELELLKSQFEKDKNLFSLMNNLFVFGYAMGSRAEKAKATKGGNQ